MADSDSDSGEFLGFTADDIDFLEPNTDSDIDFTDYESSDEEIPLQELRERVLSRDREDSTPTTSDSPVDIDESPVTNAPGKWTRKLTPITVNDFLEETGAVYTLPATANELDFFNLIFPATLFDHLAKETNLYAEQCIAKKGDGKWNETNGEEIRAFMGLHVFMSILQLPSYSNYWSTDNYFRVPSVPLIMPRSRFEKLLQYFHVNDSTQNPPKSDPNHDKLHHIRPVFDVVQQKLVECYKPHKTVSVDEAMIPFRGRLSYKQYLPAKPCKFGIKVWELADSTNGYVYQMQVYTGKENGNSEGGLSSRVVTDLTRILQGKHFHVYMDNFFSGPQLYNTLFLHGIYAAGTCRTNRRGWPDGLHGRCLPKERGSSKSYQSGNLVASSWFDKRQVNFLSTNSDPTKIVSVGRKQKDGNIVQVPAPEVVSMYNENMSGVDHGDQLRMQYPTARRSKKFWKYLFWFLFDTALSCSFILMKESPNHVIKSRSGRVKVLSQQDFRQNLCRLLIGKYRQKRRFDAVIPSTRAGGSHWPVVMPKRKRCVECLLTKVRKESNYGCEACGVNLCVTCCQAYHLRKNTGEGEE